MIDNEGHISACIIVNQDTNYLHINKIQGTELKHDDVKDGHGSVPGRNHVETLDAACSNTPIVQIYDDSVDDSSDKSFTPHFLQIASAFGSDIQKDVQENSPHPKEVENPKRKEGNNFGLPSQRSDNSRITVDTTDETEDSGTSVAIDDTRETDSFNEFNSELSCLHTDNKEIDAKHSHVSVLDRNQIKPGWRFSCNSTMDQIFADCVKEGGGKPPKLRSIGTVSTCDADGEEYPSDIEDEVEDTLRSVQDKIKLFEKKISKGGGIGCINPTGQIFDNCMIDIIGKSLKSQSRESKPNIPAVDETDVVDNSSCLDNANDPPKVGTDTMANKLSVLDRVQGLEKKIGQGGKQTKVLLLSDKFKSSSNKFHATLHSNSKLIDQEGVEDMNNKPGRSSIEMEGIIS